MFGFLYRSFELLLLTYYEKSLISKLLEMLAESNQLTFNLSYIGKQAYPVSKMFRELFIKGRLKETVGFFRIRNELEEGISFLTTSTTLLNQRFNL